MWATPLRLAPLLLPRWMFGWYALKFYLCVLLRALSQLRYPKFQYGISNHFAQGFRRALSH